MSTIDVALQEYQNASLVTVGDFSDEDQAKQVFRDAFSATECFRIFEEVDCWYFGGSVFGDKPNGRIDFLMTPQKKLIDAGWTNGIVGVEVKKSGHKVGPLICQMIDYSRAIFRLPDSSGRSLVSATLIAAFPGFSRGGTIGSIMANHRLGCCGIDEKHCGIGVGGSIAFRMHKDRGLHFVNLSCGYKNGSR